MERLRFRLLFDKLSVDFCLLHALTVSFRFLRQHELSLFHVLLDLFLLRKVLLPGLLLFFSVIFLSNQLLLLQFVAFFHEPLYPNLSNVGFAVPADDVAEIDEQVYRKSYNSRPANQVEGVCVWY